jgi:hypothetical protein
MVAAILDGGINYGAAETTVLRPEGVTFGQVDLIGADIGFLSPNSLSCSLLGCIVDLHSSRALELGTSANFLADGCYLSSAGAVETILFNAAGASVDLSETITNCDVVNIADPNQYACKVNTRTGVTYTNNTHTGYVSGIVCQFDTVSALIVSGNKFKLGATGWTAQRCIDVTLGDKVTIDKNYSYNDNKIVQLSTVNPPTSLSIGHNASTNQETKEIGAAIITIGNTVVTVNLKNNNTGLGIGSDTGLRAVVTAALDQAVTGFTVAANGANTHRVTFTIGAPAVANTTIMWQAESKGV